MALVVLIVLVWTLVTVVVVALCGMAKRGDRALRGQLEVPLHGIRHAPRTRRSSGRIPAGASRRR